MMRLLLMALAVPTTLQAQALVGEPVVPTDHPRALDIFAPVQGYDDLSDDRTGPTTKPAEHELGLVLISRIFRNTCLTLEAGAPLDDATPPGYAVFDAGTYLMGTEPTGASDRLVLSPTGDIDLDETRGHPSIWLSAQPSGMTCRLEWNMESPPVEDRALGMAQYIENWLPFEFALVRVERPLLSLDPSVSGFAEWDRPCAGKWCQMTAIYDLQRGSVILNSKLNITAIEGDRP